MEITKELFEELKLDSTTSDKMNFEKFAESDFAYFIDKKSKEEFIKIRDSYEVDNIYNVNDIELI